MTNEQKLQAYDRTLEMLEATGETMKRLKERDNLSQHGIGNLDRIINTIAWLKGEIGNEANMDAM